MGVVLKENMLIYSTFYTINKEFWKKRFFEDIRNDSKVHM